jgi:hypothetical protein
MIAKPLPARRRAKMLPLNTAARTLGLQSDALFEWMLQRKTATLAS